MSEESAFHDDAIEQKMESFISKAKKKNNRLFSDETK